MKRLLIAIIALLVAIPLAVGTIAGIAYTTTTENSVPTPKLVVMGQEVVPAGYDWHEPVFGGMIYRDFSQTAVEGESLALVSDAGLEMELPTGFEADIRIYFNNEEVWTGGTAELATYKFMNNGAYKLQVDCNRQKAEGKGYGTVSYICNFSVSVEPRLELSDEWVQQGDMVALRVYNLPNGLEPEAETTLGAVHFMPAGEGIMTGYIPVGHAREAALYDVKVTAGAYSWEVPVRVVEANYRVESLVVASEEPDPAIPEEERVPVRVSDVAPASPADYREFGEKITPLFESYDESQLWAGRFTMPIKANISVAYGQTTFASNAQGSLQQTGVGFAAEAGSPVVAPAGGKVIFAEATNNMGTVVVIEHGGGLKSLFFFLAEAEVAVGDTVEQEDQIGTTAGRGFSSEASAYYEARLGYETVNPVALFDGSSNLYYFE